MANVATQLEGGGGKKTVKTDSTWAWVDSLKNGSSALATNAEKIGSVIDDVGSVITSIFGGDSKKNEVSNAGSASLVPLLALGGGLALLLK